MSDGNRSLIATRALGLVDLTDLGDSSTAENVVDLCQRADTRHGPVAAICIWPRFVGAAAAALVASTVRIATVTNFPSGSEPLADVVGQTVAALDDGAHEIDLVLPYRALASDVGTAKRMLDAVRAAVPADGVHLLKVILETGELGGSEHVDIAARLAIEHGADFIKTSTGKTAVSATLEATAVMLTAIRDMHRPVGLKASGGIRTLDDAMPYLDQADAMMGASWISPRTFRFGASGLLKALLEEIDGVDSAVPTERDTY